MLTDLHHEEPLPEVRIKDIQGNPLFREGLEYSSPARGTWTIAHLSMLIPHSHQIYVGAAGCLRGVVLSAAEFNGLDRFSMISIKEHDIFEDSQEHLFIDGVTDILTRLPELPPAVLIYTNCIHHFVACDFDMVYRELRHRFPGVDFIDCYMIPTMRKSIMTPEALMRKQLYAALEPCEKDPMSVNIVGNCFARSPSCELVSWLTEAGYTVRDICSCREYAEYKAMAKSSVNIYTIPLMKEGAAELERRLGQEALYLPVSFNYTEIEKNLSTLAERFKLKKPDFTALETKADDALNQVKRLIGDMPVAIDYSAVSRPMELARLLLQHGFHVIRLYADAIQPGDEAAFAWLKEYAPELPVQSVVNFECRFIKRHEADEYGGRLLAIGQKAAYFTGTKHFVNLIENGDLYGFDGICRLAALMADAAQKESDTKNIIQVKAWGCCA